MTNREYFERARRVIPGGVNSPVRSFGSVGGTPICVREAKGAYLTTIEGCSLLDFCLSWGPLILGHGDPDVLHAVQQAVRRGLSYGCNHVGEAQLAELILDMMPHADRLRLVNSGTEAVITALRLARGATGRSKIVKFEGCYHGHGDSLLVSAGSGVLTGGYSSSEGVPQALVNDVHVLPYNDLRPVEEIFTAMGGQIAALIVEPIAGNMGLIPPLPGYLAGLRSITEKFGALLIFDEVITGFRFGPGTFAEFCGVRPDLTTLGKIIGGGMPIGGIAGPKEIMELLAPLGGVYQGGTLSGNPAAAAAGIATLEKLRDGGEAFYKRLEKMAARIAKSLKTAADRRGLDISVSQVGGVFTPFFRVEPPANLAQAKSADTDMYARFFHGMLKRGIYLPPSPFEVSFLSNAHGEAEVRQMEGAISEFFDEME